MQQGAKVASAEALVRRRWRRSRLKNESEHGRGEPCDPERGWDQARDLQGHPQKDTGHKTVAAYRGAGQLRQRPQRVLLRSASGCLRPGPELLSHRQASLPHGCLRTPLRGGARLLGSRLQPGRALLLDDLHAGTYAINKTKNSRNLLLALTLNSLRLGF